MKPTRCLKCGQPIEQHEGVGRPLTYCSKGCRQLAAFEIKRLQERLIKLESDLSGLRHTPDIDFRDSCGRRKPEQIAALEGEIGEAEGRLRLLLEGGE